MEVGYRGERVVGVEALQDYAAVLVPGIEVGGSEIEETAEIEEKGTETERIRGAGGSASSVCKRCRTGARGWGPRRGARAWCIWRETRGG